ncbi:MAG: hypothetical protein IPG80_21475 [Anaerolineales bacterium]|uniref:hypothetical protein n=1 Tax=Candidatus Villigracilis vicinus TaxID=3140679 RepID=UPI003134A6FF|nr:hypothetical protein [Anaerolineales bacterium]
MGRGVGGEEEKGKKKDDYGREKFLPMEVFEWRFEVGLFDKFDDDVGEKPHRGEGGEEEAKRPEENDFASRVTLSGATHAPQGGESLWRNI